MIQEIALGGLEKEDKELNQIDQAVFSKVSKIDNIKLSSCYISGLEIRRLSIGIAYHTLSSW